MSHSDRRGIQILCNSLVKSSRIVGEIMVTWKATSSINMHEPCLDSQPLMDGEAKAESPPCRKNKSKSRGEEENQSLHSLNFQNILFMHFKSDKKSIKENYYFEQSKFLISGLRSPAGHLGVVPARRCGPHHPKTNVSN